MPTSDPTPDQTPAANDQGQSGADQFYTRSQYFGLKGALEQQLKAAQTQAEALKGERDAFVGQLKDYEAQFKAAQAKLAELEPVSKKAAELEAALAGKDGLNARLKALLKYPDLLDETNLALVESSNLPADQLEALLGKKAVQAKEQASRPNPAVGATPPKTGATSDQSPEALLQSAMTKMRSGDTQGYNALMRDYYAAYEAKHGRFLPADPSGPGAPPA